ncbi:MAG: T9SS type A sorting domain-containing protein, partial [Bacteroidota bacterium]
DVVGLDPVDLQQEILLYPNPAQNAVRYDSEVKLDKIVLRNMLGQEILIIDQPAAKAEIDLSQLANDIYLISFISENGIWTQKLVVRK